MTRADPETPWPPRAGYSSRRRTYFALMGTCIGLITLAWSVVRLFSTTAAVVMSVIAMVIPPIAAVIGNTSDPDDPA